VTCPTPRDRTNAARWPYPKDAFPTQKVHGPTSDRALRLITCGGSFDSAKRSYRDNIVVYAVRSVQRG
jgi:hypothetical protein